MSWAGHLPLLLTPSDSLSAPAAAALQALAIKHVVILGGTGAVSSTVEQQVEALGISTERLQGSDRQQTAIAIAGAEQVHLGFGTSQYDLARGDSFPDALAGGALGGLLKAPTLLTSDPADLGLDTQTFLNLNDGSINKLFAFGGTAAISAGVLSQAVSVTTCAPTSSTTTSTTVATTTTSSSPTTTTLVPATTTTSTTSTTLPLCNVPVTTSTTSTTSTTTSTSTTSTTKPTTTTTM